jgi:predicted O-methyltransferase YrrM
VLTVAQLAEWCLHPQQLSTAVQEPPADAMVDMHKHIMVLYSLARWLPALTTVEIGCHDGTSTLPLLLAASQVGGTVYSIDIAPCPAAEENVAAVELRDPWRFIQGDSRLVRAMTGMFADASVDLLLIDGDHSPAGVLADVEAWASTVRPGGLMLFHDYYSVYPGVREAVERLTLERASRALWTVITLPWGYGLTIAVRQGLLPGVRP